MNTDTIHIDFETTPQLWQARRDSYCGCGTSNSPRHLLGHGKTPIAAVADLLEQELDAEDVRSTGDGSRT